MTQTKVIFFNGIFFILFSVILLLVSPVEKQVLAAKVTLNKVEVTVEEQGIRIQTKLKNAFNPDLLEALQSGIPVEFYFQIELIKKRRFWFNDTLDKEKILHNVSYDTLNKHYKFTSNDGKVITTQVTESLDECKEWMQILKFLLPFSEDIMEGKGYYYIKVAAESKFSAPGIFRTKWVSSKKFSLN